MGDTFGYAGSSAGRPTPMLPFLFLDEWKGLNQNTLEAQMKNCQNPTTPINQGLIQPFAPEDTSHPLCQIRGIAELFFPNEDSKEITQLGPEAYAGISCREVAR